MIDVLESVYQDITHCLLFPLNMINGLINQLYIFNDKIRCFFLEHWVYEICTAFDGDAFGQWLWSYGSKITHHGSGSSIGFDIHSELD